MGESDGDRTQQKKKKVIVIEMGLSQFDASDLHYTLERDV